MRRVQEGKRWTIKKQKVANQRQADDGSGVDDRAADREHVSGVIWRLVLEKKNNRMIKNKLFTLRLRRAVMSLAELSPCQERLRGKLKKPRNT